MLKYLYAKFINRLRGTAIKNSSIDKTSHIDTGCNILEVNMDKYSYCSHDSQIVCCDIGAFCSISDHVYIGGAEHSTSWLSTSALFYKNKSYGWPKKCFSNFDLPATKRTSIGNDVWIGHGAIIKAGVSIGDGSVIGAGAVVTKDVPPYAIVGGCPARVIRYRFDSDLIKQLLDTQWWSLDDEKISVASPYIREPERFIEMVKKLS